MAFRLMQEERICPRITLIGASETTTDYTDGTDAENDEASAFAALRRGRLKFCPRITRMNANDLFFFWNFFASIRVIRGQHRSFVLRLGAP
jgi:hypothetical protein